MILVDTQTHQKRARPQDRRLDCQQQLRTYGLLSGAFRLRRLRSYLRQRAMLVDTPPTTSSEKALTQMNVKLDVISLGKTGTSIRPLWVANGIQ